MKRYHVIGLALLAGFIAGCSIPAHAETAKPLVLVCPNSAKDSEDIHIFTFTETGTVERDKSQKVVFSYFYGGERVISGHKALFFTTQQVGESKSNSSDWFFLMPGNGVAMNLVRAHSEYNASGKEIISDRGAYTCFDADTLK